MSVYAVYTRQGSFPERLFKTRKDAVDFIGNATGLLEIRRFEHLTTKQVVMLSLPYALDFESAMNYAVSNTQKDMEK